MTRLSFSERRAPQTEDEPEIVEVVPLPTAMGDGCSASNDSVKIVPLDSPEGSRPAVFFSRPGVETNLRLFRSVPAGSFDALRFEVATSGLFLLRGLARRKGASLSTEVETRFFAAHPTPLTPGSNLVFRTVEYDFAELALGEGTFDELVLHKPTASAPLFIRKVELVRRGERALPTPIEGPEFVGRVLVETKPIPPSAESQRRDHDTEYAIESRPSVGLQTGAVFAVELGQPAADEIFVLDAVLERETDSRFSGEAEGREIELRLQSAAGVTLASATHRLERDWRSLRMALSSPNFDAADLAGASIEIEGLAEIRALLSCPRLERPGLDLGNRPRTVLLITSDTHRADHVGYSSPPGFVSTPNLDALKSRGVSFSNCYSQTNVTNPSHVALMTAFHPRDSGVVNNFSTLSSDAQTLAEEFAEAGYLTFASISTPHLAESYSGLRQGFDRVAGPELQNREAHGSVAAVEKWLDDAGEAPVFLWLHLFDAHFPYVPPADLDLKYYPEGRDPRDPQRTLPRVEGAVIDFLTAEGITDEDYAPAQYRAEIDSLDRALGPLLSRPRIADGLVAFTADHGEALGERSIYCGHLGLYPATLHVPL
ncbi:MAG: sulfatase-like hydrolase/transferase, partial [Planctomycetota bacterium]